MRNRLSFEDLLLIAEALLGISYEELEQTVCVFRAEMALAAPFTRIFGAYLYPGPDEQAAVCALRLIRTRPFPLGNKQIAYECMREMLVRGGCLWSRPEEDAEEVAGMLKAAEAGTAGEAEFVRWVRSRVDLGERMRA